MTNMQRLEIISVLSFLPPEKVNEVTEFAKKLKDEYGFDGGTDVSDEWTDEDYADATQFAMNYGYAGLEDDE